MNKFLFLEGRPLDNYLHVIGVRKGRWELDADGLVNVVGDVNLQGKLGKEYSFPVRFGTVTGNFLCNGNQLVSLEGAPKEVGGVFDCSDNQLKSLEYAPTKVGGDYLCGKNQIANFKGMEGASLGASLIVTDLENTTDQDNVFVSVEGLPVGLYEKVIGLDIAAMDDYSDDVGI